MLYTLETKAGSISIAKAVIGKIVSEAVKQLGGRAMLSNHKGKTLGLVAKIGGIDDVNYMDIQIGENGLEVKFYIVTKFGTSINNVSQQLIKNIRLNIEKITEFKVDNITVVVTGVLSKQLVRRNIEIRG